MELIPMSADKKIPMDTLIMSLNESVEVVLPSRVSVVVFGDGAVSVIRDGVASQVYPT